MKGLDDGPDGLNDDAFDAAMERAAARGDALRDEQKGEAAIRAHNKRQAIPVLRDPAITYETKFATDLTTKLHRYRCATCATVGAWLEQMEVVRRNAQIHVTAHAQGDIR